MRWTGADRRIRGPGCQSAEAQLEAAKFSAARRAFFSPLVFDVRPRGWMAIFGDAALGEWFSDGAAADAIAAVRPFWFYELGRIFKVNIFINFASEEIRKLSTRCLCRININHLRTSMYCSTMNIWVIFFSFFHRENQRIDPLRGC